MSFIIINKKLYFQTDKAFLKYEQIMCNNKVAVCYNNIQIEGLCKEFGHPLNPQNNVFIKKYKQFFKSSYEKYSHIESETIFEISPTFITLWRYEDDKPFREYFDVTKKTYKKDFYKNY